MPDERLRTKSELKRLVAADVKRKGWTDDMVSILIDVLWRDKYTMRTSGFYYPGGTDAIINFDDATRTFSIEPLDPLVQDFIPRYGFYSWSQRAVYHRRYETETIILPDEEGLFAIYFAADDNIRTQTLHFVKNPSEKETKDLYTKQVIVSFIYWDFDMQTALHFGNDRHGSQWNPQMHWMMHKTLKGQINEGLSVTNMLINEDGSLDSHARFTVNSGTMWHDDLVLDIPTAGGTNTIPVLYFANASVPRFVQTTGFGIYKASNRITYNLNNTSLIEADNGKFVMYHIFAVNEHIDTTKQVISVMGNMQYDSIALAHKSSKTELDSIYANMPQQGRCYLGTVIYEVNDNFTNSIKARIVFFIGQSHLPVTIAHDSVDYLEIDENQVLKYIPPEETTVFVEQIAHGFSVGQPIRHNETIFVGAIANNVENAKTAGIVTKVIDADNFKYQSEGFFVDAAFEAGKEYFLSPLTSSLITLADPEVWNIGEVRQSLGWGTPQGLKIEIDVGDEITTDFGIGIPGETGPIGPAGADGLPGADGADGIDGAVGPAGANGLPGADGDSAYEVAMAGGFVGTEAEWLASLIGADGVDGADGASGLPGADGYTPVKNVDYFDGADGADGSPGLPGADGADGYTPVKDVDYFDGADGAPGLPGADGATGPAGADGTDGDSAYEVAVAGGFVGTEAQWLASLVGVDGTDGADGADSTVPGPIGPEGPQGIPGVDGADGSDAACMWQDYSYWGIEPIATKGVHSKGGITCSVDEWIAMNVTYNNGWKAIQNGYGFLLTQNTDEVTMNISANYSNAGSSFGWKYITFNRLTGAIKASNFVLDSERKLKKNITSIQNTNIANIPLRQFIFKNDEQKRLRYGAIVDEVEPIAPELIYQDGKGKQIAYFDLLLAKVALLEKTITKMQDEINQLKNKY